MSTVWKFYESSFSKSLQGHIGKKKHWLLLTWVKGLPNALPNTVFPRDKVILRSSQ